MFMSYLVTMAIGVDTIAKLIVGLMKVMLLVMITMIMMIRVVMMVMVSMITHTESSNYRNKNKHSASLHHGAYTSDYLD